MINLVNVKEDLINKVFGKLTVVGRAEDRVDKNGKHFARWLCECSCEQHTKKIVEQCHLRRGKILSCGCYNKDRIREAHKKTNVHELYDNYGVLWTSNTNEEVYFDIEDAEKILEHCWYKDVTGYPASTINGKTIRLHAFLGFKWHDHCDRNKLNNKKENLRPCTYNQNGTNKGLRRDNVSGVVGVYWYARDRKWKSQINIDGQVKYLGAFVNKEDAIKARLKAEFEHYGDFAPQRHLFEEYNIKLGVN